MSKKITQPDTAAAPAAVFQQKAIRRTLHNDEWWFVITDIVAALTDAADPSDYWKKMRRRDPDLSLDSQGGGPIDPPLALAFETAGGRQKLQCWNTQGIFRLIQSIPSPKAEPFKRWLAKVGKERLDEIENPELAMGRMQELYEKKGYPKEWIDKRLRGIAVRQDLTDEWKARGVKEGKEYSILTAEIARATFGVTPGAHSRLKGLDKVRTGNNLRDHMTDLELIFTMLGEAGTTEIARRKDAQGLVDNRTVAKEGGTIAGNARKELEAKSGKPVVSRSNYLPPPADCAVLENVAAPGTPIKRKAVVRQKKPKENKA